MDMVAVGTGHVHGVGERHGRGSVVQVRDRDRSKDRYYVARAATVSDARQVDRGVSVGEYDVGGSNRGCGEGGRQQAVHVFGVSAVDRKVGAFTGIGQVGHVRAGHDAAAQDGVLDDVVQYEGVGGSVVEGPVAEQEGLVARFQEVERGGGVGATHVPVGFEFLNYGGYGVRMAYHRVLNNGVGVSAVHDDGDNVVVVHLIQCRFGRSDQRFFFGRSVGKLCHGS